ncbi:hypothetical protein N7507_000361 [Penicillium longicatenatum]|nr:hypothetical protein N7507_000361 [Penicillium longicatenatum]
MKLDQQEKYGKFAIFIAGAYLMKNTIHDVHFLVPMQRTPHFVGRQYELALCGLGGIGKTQIAIQFAHQLMERDAGISVFWVNGSNVSAVEESYHRIAAKCKILSTGQLDSFLIFRVKEWLESERAGRFLMIFDNVEDYFMGKEYDIYIPKCSHGSILFTTRDQRFAKNFCLPSHIVKVPIITELDSVMLLKKFLPSSLNLGTSDDLALLSKKLGHHPLAITQAAAYLRSMRRPILEYLRYFENQQKAMRILKYKALDFTRDKGWESLYSTWEISFERVEEEDALGFDVLALMSFLDPDTIPMFLLAQEFTDILSLSEAISNLRSMSLISPYNEGETYAIHPLIQLFMQDRLESQGDRQRFLSMSLHLLARLFPENPDECSDTSSVLLPHATKILKLEAVSHEDLLARAELLHKVSQCELKRGRLRNAEELAREAFLINSKLLGRTARATANCQVHLARALVALGKYHEARESAAESFEAFQEIDPCGPDTLRSMDNLAEVLRHQGQYHEAQEMHEKAFTLKERLLGRSHPDTLVSLNNLALTYWIQGRFKEAETLTVEVMEARNMKLGVDHSDILISMNNLASIYMSQGRWKEAEQLELQVVETRRVKLGVDHPDTLASLHNLASTYLSQGRFKEAEHLLEQVLETRKLKLGVDHPDTLMSMSNLASMYMSQDRREEAEQLQLRVVETRRMKLSVDHPDTLMSMSNLASMYMSQDRWEEAEQLQLQVVENRRMKLGVDHRDTLMSMSNLASMYMSQNRWEEAERLELQVVETRRMKLGVDHPDTLMSMSNLASMYMSQDRREEAEQLQLQVVENRRMKLGVDHRDTLMSMSNLASTYMSQNRWEEAERLELQVVETRRMKLSVDHPDTLTSMANLAFIWKILGRYAEAINLLREALSGQEQILGSSHPFTLSNSEALLEWETEQLTISS